MAAVLVLVVATLVLLAPAPAGPPVSSVSPRPTASSSPSPSPTPSVAPTGTAAPEQPSAPVCADDVLTCVNIERASAGLSPLAADGTLDAASQACADRIAAEGGLTHSSATPGYATWGENIASGYPTAAAVVAGWMGSDGHRANILSPNYTVMGIGYSAAGSYWCQQFGG